MVAAPTVRAWGGLLAGGAALLLGGCLGAWLDTPYVFATGLGAVNSLTPSTRQTLLVATDSGLHELDGSGRWTTLSPMPARAVATHKERVYALVEGRLWVGPWPAVGGIFRPATEVAEAGAVDLLAWVDETVLIAIGDRVDLFDPRSGTQAPWVVAPAPIVGLAWQRRPEGPAALILTGTQLLRKQGHRLDVVVDGLVGATAVGVDRHERAFVAAGEAVYAVGDEGALTRLSGGGADDLVFGTGGLLSPDNAYLGSPAGRVDFIRVPPPG